MKQQRYRQIYFKKKPHLAAAPSLPSPWLGATVSKPTGWWVQWHMEWLGAHWTAQAVG